MREAVNIISSRFEELESPPYRGPWYHKYRIGIERIIPTRLTTPCGSPTSFSTRVPDKLDLTQLAGADPGPASAAEHEIPAGIMHPADSYRYQDVSRMPGGGAHAVDSDGQHLAQQYAGQQYLPSTSANASASVQYGALGYHYQHYPHAAGVESFSTHAADHYAGTAPAPSQGHQPDPYAIATTPTPAVEVTAAAAAAAAVTVAEDEESRKRSGEDPVASTAKRARADEATVTQTS